MQRPFSLNPPVQPCLRSVHRRVYPLPCSVVLGVAMVLALGALPLWAGPGAAVTPAAADAPVYGKVAIEAIGHRTLTAIQQHGDLAWWVELDDHLLVLAQRSALDTLPGRPAVEILSVEVRPDDLYLIRRGHGGQLRTGNFDVLARGGRFAVVQSHGGEPSIESLHDDADLLSHGADGHDESAHGREKSLHAAVFPFVPNVVLARQQGNRPEVGGAAKGRSLERRYGEEAAAMAQALVDEVDPGRWFAAVEVLAGFNRYTHSPELLQARDWLVQEFDALPGLDVTTVPFEVGSTVAYNVVATLTGSQRPDQWHLIGAHYDSISQNTGSAAPGAEDNASGCAGVLEMARIFAAHPPQETVVFLCYSGEELGLIGSENHASRVVNDGHASKVETMLNMDMIGYTSDSDLDVLLETDTAFATLLDPFADAAAEYTDLRVVTTLFAFGSDHVPYLNRNMPALLTIENDWDSYPGYHRTNDVPANLSLDMGGEILRMNVGAMALRIGSTATGGPEGLFADGFESGNVASWSAAVP